MRILRAYSVLFVSCALASAPAPLLAHGRRQPPTAEEIAWSERVVAAFAGNPSGVVKMDGKMLDKPHLRAAEKILALRGGEARRRKPGI